MRDAAAPILPRVLLVGRTRHQVPFAGAEARKFAAVGELLDWHVLARTQRSHVDDRVTLVGRSHLPKLDGLLFQLRLPLAIARAIRSRQPQVIVAQDPFAGAAALLARRLARRDAAVVVEVHGDWRTATRLYGSRARRLLGRPADAIAAAALRRADAVRAISDYTAGLVCELGGTVEAQFPTFLDLEPFAANAPVSLPLRPSALFVGVLERYKNVDGLLDAWTNVRRRVPDARLHIVGKGRLAPLVERAVTLDQSVEYTPALTREELSLALDQATCLVLPSRSEGMGRVVVEAFARGRAVIASTVGGLPELVADGETGLLVDLQDPASLEAALVRLLADRETACRLGAKAAERASTLNVTPKDWAGSLAAIVQVAQVRHTERPVESPVLAPPPAATRVDRA